MKDKNIAGLIALFLGGLGLHRFYLGQPVLAVFYLLFCWTFIPVILGFIDALVFFSESRKSFDVKYNNGAYSMNSGNPLSMRASKEARLSSLLDETDIRPEESAASGAIRGRSGRRAISRTTALYYNGEKVAYVPGKYSFTVTNVNTTEDLQ
ncbi:TM2 domain-containing protein [Telluribacter sp. SYSU D00476]|uniref:TM2 domain-containing protein n=1 Tax=Telluribacter sp. SYSU D00476 TaxID=2811430 RepID=UPI001FF4AED3|nr:TM2 domain-containing protein [Telluribacter sp. SYSU D00476]